MNHVVMVMALTILYLFLIQRGQEVSRLAMILTGIFYVLLTYAVRELWKCMLCKKMVDGGDRKLLIITSKDVAEQVIQNIKEHNYARYALAGAVVVDTDWTCLLYTSRCV